MVIRVTMSTTSGGELDSRRLIISDDAEDSEVSETIHSALQVWTLSPGDVITIIEEE